MTTIVDPLFRELTDGICVSDAQGNILYMNPAAQRMLDLEGNNRNVKICDHLCGHLADDGCGDCASKCPLRQPGTPEKSVTFRGKYGPKVTYKWKEMSFKKLERWKNLRVRCLRMPTTLFDSWETEKHFTLIEDASSEVELERSKDAWRSMIAHDLRTPLTNIYSVLRTIEEIPLGTPKDEREQSLLQISNRACKRMGELLDLFLELAQLAAGAMPIQAEDLSLHDLVQKTVEEQSQVAQSRKIKIELAVAENLAVKADTRLLFRVIQNILNNALKFTPEGGHVTITAAAANSKKVELRIKDTGPGIAPEDIPFIFDRFYQARARQEGKIKGTGLGLAFCRESLKAMSGDIDVESTPGKGSEFIVELPPGVLAPVAGLSGKG